jgi:hypothetical protein
MISNSSLGFAEGDSALVNVVRSNDHAGYDRVRTALRVCSFLHVFIEDLELSTGVYK